MGLKITFGFSNEDYEVQWEKHNQIFPSSRFLHRFCEHLTEIFSKHDGKKIST